MKPCKQPSFNPAQAELFAIVWQPRQRGLRLRANDVIRIDSRLCRVLRVNDCSAVVLMGRPPREFVTRFDRRVRFQLPPITFRISPNSEVEILNRHTK